MPVVTKSGDDGKSRWLGKTVDKDGVLLETIGALDELMAGLGILATKRDDFGKIWNRLYHDVYMVSGYVAGCNEMPLTSETEEIENDIKRMEKDLGPITFFFCGRGRRPMNGLIG